MSTLNKNTFQTARLQFTPLVPSDAPALYNDLRTAPSVMKWSRQGRIDYNLQDTISWINKLAEGMNVPSPSSDNEGSKPVGMVFSIREGEGEARAEEDKIIGTIGVRLTKSELSEGEQFELGYMFVPSVWGKGYATEAVRGFVRWWFEFSEDYFASHSNDDDNDGVYAVVAKENGPSLRVMEKCGFRVHGEGKDEHGTEIVEYRISRSDV
ncbi:GNAT domain-containing protein [Aspergillus spectabilis]